MKTTKTIWRVQWRPDDKSEWSQFATTRGKRGKKEAMWMMNHYGSQRRVLKITTITEIINPK